MSKEKKAEKKFEDIWKPIPIIPKANGSVGKGEWFSAMEWAKQIIEELNENIGYKQLELMPKISEKEYKSKIENTNDLLFILNNEALKFEFINEPVSQKILDFGKHELYNKYNLNLFPSEYITNILRNQIEIRENKEKEVNLGYKDKNSKFFWFELKGKRYIDNDGLNKTLFIGKDITDRKQMRRDLMNAVLQLIDSEIKYRLISERANDLIFTLNEHSQIEYINERITHRILGFVKNELIGKKLNEFIHPEDIENAKELIALDLKKEEAIKEIRFKKKDGKYIWLELNYNTFIGADGKYYKLLIGRDISHRKYLEQKIKKSEQRYRLIAENLNDTIIILDNKFKIEYINRELDNEIIDYTRKDLIGKDVLKLIQKDDLINALIEGRKEWNKEGRTMELRFKRKDGNYNWLELKSKR
ncbi:MAG: PAS domain S-box protein, partial [Promethearchaeota archaeon]